MDPKKIVLVEDDANLSKILAGELRGAGFEVTQAFDGEQGLDLVKRELPDLVLLDLLMPKMHGFEVLQEIRKFPATAHIRIFIFTVLNEEKVMREGLRLGANDYLVKSQITLPSLVAKIREALG